MRWRTRKSTTCLRASFEGLGDPRRIGLLWSSRPGSTFAPACASFPRSVVDPNYRRSACDCQECAIPGCLCSAQAYPRAEFAACSQEGPCESGIGCCLICCVRVGTPIGPDHLGHHPVGGWVVHWRILEVQGRDQAVLELSRAAVEVRRCLRAVWPSTVVQACCALRHGR